MNGEARVETNQPITVNMQIATPYMAQHPHTAEVLDILRSSPRPKDKGCIGMNGEVE